MSDKNPKQFNYLEQLRFDDKLKNSWIAKYLGNVRIVMLLLLTVVGLGLYSFFTLPRELNPEIKIPIVVVSTVLPGAGPEDVEQLITIPLEDRIKSVKGISTYSSVSQENVSSITIEFTSDVDPKQAETDIASEVDKVTDLPEDATDPIVQAVDFQDSPVWTFSIIANGDKAGLARFAENLRDRIEEESIIDRVEVSGLDQREIQIIVSPEVVRELGISPITLSQSISSALSSYPAGSVQTRGSAFSVSLDQNITSVSDLRATRVSIGGVSYSLEEIATIVESSSPGQADSLRAAPDEEPEQVVTFYVYKTTGSKIDEATLAAQEIVEAETAKYPQIQYNTIIDYSKEITDQFESLASNFGQTILLVFVVMLIFLGLREAFLASLSIPLSILITFSVMQATGITLSFISMFSLLLALGLLVDNAIVIISAINSYYRSGKFTPQQTGLLVWKDFFMALIGTNITTVWAFLPLLLATGIIGEFIKPIPIVVSTTILASALVGFFLTLPIALLILKPEIPRRVKVLGSTLVFILLAFLLLGALPRELYLPATESNEQLAAGFSVINGLLGIVVPILAFVAAYILLKAGMSMYKKAGAVVHERFKENPHREERLRQVVDNGFISLTRVGEAYRRRLEKVLNNTRARRIAVTLVVFFSIISYMLPAMGLVKNEFFPAEDSDILYVQIELPSGTNAGTAEAEAFRVANQLRTTEELEFITAEVGRAAPTGFGGGGANNLVLFTLNLTPTDERDATSTQIAETLRKEFAAYTTGTLSVVELSGGPPAGSDIQISYLGADLQQLDTFAQQTKTYLETVPGVNNIDQTIKSGTSKLVFVPDRTLLAEYGVTEQTIGLWLRTLASGFEIDQLKIDGTDYDIVFRLNSTIENPEDLSAITIPTQNNGLVPLLALGRVELRSNPTIINREEGRRTIAVTAGVQEGFNIPEIGAQLEQWADSELNLPPGYEWKTGGVNEENNRSVQSIIQAMGLSAVLILITLVLQLGSFRKAVIVMLVIPLALSGVFVVFGITGIPLSFPALIGMLALFGIVVNNSIIIVEKINQNLEVGFPLDQAISDASAQRLEPIVLTSLTTIIGLVPITLSDPLWQGLGGAIIAGLTFSGAMMLFFIPVVYYMWFQHDTMKKS